MHIAAIVYILLATLVVAAQCCSSKSKSELAKEYICKHAQLENRLRLVEKHSSEYALHLRGLSNTPARLGDIPWHVSIQRTNEERIICGGSIISKDFILTAAHCTKGKYPSYFRVVAGTVNAFQPGSTGSTHSVTEIHDHELFDSSTTKHDISIWKIDPPFSFTTYIRAVDLPAQETCTLQAEFLTASGWGDENKEGMFSESLLKVNVPIMFKQLCDCRYSEMDGIFVEGQICSGFDLLDAETSYSSCLGDYGGPLFLNNELRGIISSGKDKKDCASPGFPAIYTEVSAYRSWIKAKTGV